MNLRNSLRQHAKNLIGRSLDTRYLVIESDDWGSIRMPSVDTYKRLQSKGVDLGEGEAGRYNKTDTLASAEDFEQLFDLLRSFRDHRGRHPVFTAVSLTSNPDFEKIKAADFQHYFHEPFTKTLERYGQSTAFDYWKSGIEQQLFVPQFHAREHLYVPLWLRMLQKGDPATLHGFEEGCWGFLTQTPYNISYQASFDLETIDDLVFQEEAISDGLDLFEQLHGYRADFIVPPNGPFNRSLEKITAEHGIKYVGASKIQREPLGQGKTKKSFHWLGQKNKHGQYYLTRNAFFEPNAPGKDWVASCLKDIEYAFRWNKPAVISSHRTNYIGSLNPDNRDLGLQQLKMLLTKVLDIWSDVEFISSNELGDLIASK